jgi:hypothetical protein
MTFDGGDELRARTTTGGLEKAVCGFFGDTRDGEKDKM